MHMRIYLVRHGETTGDIENRFGGDYDDHLTQRGIDESKALALKLASNKVQAIYSSPLSRARETAAFISESTGAQIKFIKGLKERNHYGLLTGMVKPEAKKIHPEHVAELQKGLHHSLQGSESYSHFKERVIRAFDEAIGEAFSPIVIVTHGGVIKCIVRDVLKMGELDGLSDCAILTIDKTATGLTLTGLDGSALKKK